MRVAELRHYPVKSMLGESLDAAAVGAQGLAGDRRWAVLDEQSGRVASAKQPRLWRALLSATAQVVDDEAWVSLPGWSDPLAVSDPQLAVALSALLGRPVRLSDQPRGGAGIERADPDEVLDRGMAAEVSSPELLLGQAVTGPTFLDYAPLHLMTAATLTRTGRATARYRPNLVLSGGLDQRPFAENDWVGATISVGEEVRLRVVLPTPRCAVPTLAHGALPPDPDALRVLMAANRIEVPGFGVLPVAGVYAQVEQSGQVRTGDVVTVMA